MSSLKPIEKRAFEDLFGMSSGFVLDYSNGTFSDTIKDVAGIDIYDAKYERKGGSKAKRLKAFWQLEDDAIVGSVLSEMLAAWLYQNTSGKTDARYIKGLEVVERLLPLEDKEKSNTSADFLERKIELPQLSKLQLDPRVTNILDARINEIEATLNTNAPLATIFMCGSVLEGILLGVALGNPAKFNQSASRPKDSSGKVRQFHDWRLSDLINVACDVGVINLDVKKFSHALRDFRNYIHPYQQMSSNFTPDKQTAEICFQVLKAAIVQLTK